MLKIYTPNKDDTVYLDDLLNDENGTPLILISDNEANLTRLRTLLLLCTKTLQEQKVVELLCDGYDKMSIARKFKVSKQYITELTQRIKRRWLGLKPIPKKKKNL